MKARSVFSAFCLFLIIPFTSSGSSLRVGLYPESILKLEITVNEMIINTFLLEMDYFNNQKRTDLKESTSNFAKLIDTLPRRTNDNNKNKLLNNIISLWDKVKNDISSIALLQTKSPPPNVNQLLKNLDQLDRKLSMFRQLYMKQIKVVDQCCQFLESMLTVQKISREYLHAVFLERNGNPTVISEMQLRNLAAKFDSDFISLQKKYGDRPSVDDLLRQISLTWPYIRTSIEHYPGKQVQSLMLLYGQKIIKNLKQIDGLM